MALLPFRFTFFFQLIELFRFRCFAKIFDELTAFICWPSANAGKSTVCGYTHENDWKRPYKRLGVYPYIITLACLAPICTILTVNNWWYFNPKGQATLYYTRAHGIPFSSMFDFLYLKTWVGKCCVCLRDPAPCDPADPARRDPALDSLAWSLLLQADCSRFAFLIFTSW